MLTDQIRSLRDATPFRPFVIQLVDGLTNHLIREPGNLILTPDGIVALVDTGGQLHIINSFQILQVTLERAQREGAPVPS